jgi:hypothetical protein
MARSTQNVLPAARQLEMIGGLPTIETLAEWCPELKNKTLAEMEGWKHEADEAGEFYPWQDTDRDDDEDGGWRQTAYAINYEIEDGTLWIVAMSVDQDGDWDYAHSADCANADEYLEFDDSYIDYHRQEESSQRYYQWIVDNCGKDPLDWIYSSDPSEIMQIAQRSLDQHPKQARRFAINQALRVFDDTAVGPVWFHVLHDDDTDTCGRLLPTRIGIFYANGTWPVTIDSADTLVGPFATPDEAMVAWAQSNNVDVAGLYHYDPDE